jgi:tRNA threonylcarbamoyladenosine biosynthesis protein TsaE
LGTGTVVALEGSLGAGKTTLVKGIALGLEIEEPVTSPTFAIIQEYCGRLPLFHIDLYRIREKAEIDDLGLEEYIFGDGVCVIEWPDKADALLPAQTLRVAITVADDGKRHFELSGKD